ncbi:MAG: hypothetical protein RMK75_05295 [Aquificaceae bacterium]|nr:hypothetical protein [Aquificaceae bacterium]MDW8423721.1 hypothetical protein [Aquificaceae bacterium]
MVESPVYLDERIKVSVKTDEWKYEPRILPKHVIPVYIQVENNTDATLKIRPEDVYITDAKGNRYKPLDAMQVNESMRQELAWWYPHFWFVLGDFPDIINRAFRWGDIPPKTQRLGFVYFPALPSNVDSAVLHIKEYKFNLKLRKY